MLCEVCCILNVIKEIFAVVEVKKIFLSKGEDNNFVQTALLLHYIKEMFAWQFLHVYYSYDTLGKNFS